LYRPGKNTRFRLCIDRARAASWLIVRLDNQTLSVLDRKGETLFTRETEPEGKYQVQYYDFGAGLRLVALADLDQDQLQLFDWPATKWATGCCPPTLPHPSSTPTIQTSCSCTPAKAARCRPRP
jgi:hypothetical protein